MQHPIITTNDKQTLVDWYFQQLANDLGPHAELFVSTGEVTGELGQQLVEKRLAYRSNV